MNGQGRANPALIVALALFLVPALPGLLGPTGNSQPPAAHGFAPQGHTLPVVHPREFPVPRTAHPLQGHEFYTQEGATVAQLNDSNTLTGAHSLSEEFTLVTSPYPIAYELNGLTDTGDWYQIVIADNWPGCPSGFAMGVEVWSAALNTTPVICSFTISFSAGDSIHLGLNFTASKNVCLDVRDSTNAQSNIDCTAQPDSGGSEFVTVSGIANADGFYTGPMTEIINQTADACPDYTTMPRLDYRWPPGTWVSQYTPWSDEFDLFYGTLCYSGGGSTNVLSRTDVTSQFVDTAQGTSYGPHWGAGQNFSHLNSAYGWRYETDPVPITNVTLASDADRILVAQTAHLSLAYTGGVAPATAMWWVGGVLQNDTSFVFSYTGTQIGLVSIDGAVVDKVLNAAGPPSPFVLNVTVPLNVPGLTASPGSGSIDAGQSVRFSVNPIGGFPPYSYAWSGLPSACPSIDASRLTCTPPGPGTLTVGVTVTDANLTQIQSPPLTYVVAARPLASLSANLTELDLGQSVAFTVSVAGGARPLTYAWTGTPSGCPAPAVGVLACSPTGAGSYTVDVTVTDANGVLSVTSPVTVLVHPAPRVSFAANRTVGEVGQVVSFTAAATGGSGTYTYHWSGLPTGCVIGNSSRIVCTFGSAETVHPTVTVVDPIGGSASATGTDLVIYPGLAVSIQISPASAAVGDLVNFTATVTGGDGAYRFVWTGVPPSCYAPPQANFTCVLEDSGSFPVSLEVYDGLGVKAGASGSLVSSGGPSTASGPAGSTTWLLIALVVAAAILGTVVLLVRRNRRASGAEEPQLEEASPPSDEAPPEP